MAAPPPYNPELDPPVAPDKPSPICGRCKLYKIKPEIPMYGPYNTHLETGTEGSELRNGLQVALVGKTYLYCTCGKSKKQPFCDGSHAGTDFRPLPFKLETEVRLSSICGCKYTRSPPFCDGSHGPMPADPDVPPCRCDRPPSW